MSKINKAYILRLTRDEMAILFAELTVLIPRVDSTTAGALKSIRAKLLKEMNS